MKRSSAGLVIALVALQLTPLPGAITGTVIKAGTAIQQPLRNARLELTGGTSVHGLFSFRHGRCDWLRLTGERGTLSIDRYAARLELARTRTDVGAVRRSVWPRPWAPPPWRLRKALRPAWEPSYGIALRAFVAACRGAAVALPSAEDGLRSLEALTLAEEAAVTEVA